LLHGPVGDRSVAYWLWYCVPLLLYLWRRVMTRVKRAGVLREVTLEPPNVLRLAFDWSESAALFRYQEGMYHLPGIITIVITTRGQFWVVDCELPAGEDHEIDHKKS
jgi:hypothetical protein